MFEEQINSILGILNLRFLWDIMTLTGFGNLNFGKTCCWSEALSIYLSGCERNYWTSTLWWRIYVGKQEGLVSKSNCKTRENFLY